MAKFFLKFGAIDKRLLLPFIAAILYMILDLIEYCTKMSDLHIIFDLYSRGISYTAIIIIPLIQKYLNKTKTENEQKFKCNKRTVLHFFFLYLGYIIYFLLYVYLTKLKNDDPEDTKDYKLSHYKGLCCDVGLQIIYIAIISKFLLKTKLYIHHFIGLVIFIIFSLCADIIFNSSLFKPRIYFILIFCVFLSTDSLFMTYEKYMMDKLYYSPYIIVFSIGLLFLFLAILSTIIVLINGGIFYNGNKYLIQSFSDYFKEVYYKEVIIHIFYLTTFRIVLNALKILTIYYLTPNHIYSAYILIKEFDLLLEKESNYKYLSIILFVFEFISLLIFLEIIELNFLNLNKNTKRNIEKREIKDSEGLSDINMKEDNESNLIEIEPGYLFSVEIIDATE